MVESTAVLAGVCATDPYRSMPQFLQQLKALGFCGVQNFPTVGLIDGVFRQNLEATGMAYQQEVEMVRIARGMDLLTAPYVFNIDEAERMTKAGADVLVVHFGLTTGGNIGATGECPSLDDCVQTMQSIRDACVQIEPNIIVLCHGGPVSGTSRVPRCCITNHICYQVQKKLAMSWSRLMESTVSLVPVVSSGCRLRQQSRRTQKPLSRLT